MAWITWLLWLIAMFWIAQVLLGLLGFGSAELIGRASSRRRRDEVEAGARR